MMQSSVSRQAPVPVSAVESLSRLEKTIQPFAQLVLPAQSSSVVLAAQTVVRVPRLTASLRWLRRLPIDRDLALNLLAGEWAVC